RRPEAPRDADGPHRSSDARLLGGMAEPAGRVFRARSLSFAFDGAGRGADADRYRPERRRITGFGFRVPAEPVIAGRFGQRRAGRMVVSGPTRFSCRT